MIFEAPAASEGMEMGLSVPEGVEAEIEEALNRWVGRAPLGVGNVGLIGPAGDFVALIAAEGGAGDGGDSVLGHGIAASIERDGDDIDALHAEAGAEGDGAADRDGACCGEG